MFVADAPTTSSSAFTQTSDIARRFHAGVAPRDASRCSLCALQALCNPADLNAEELEQVDSLVAEVRSVQRGASLFRANDPFHSVYVLRSGSFDVENVAFEGARVPDLNGAGIRFERGRLTLRRCRFSLRRLHLCRSTNRLQLQE